MFSMTLAPDPKATKRLKEMQAFRRRLKRDPELLKKFMARTGIWTKSGKLAKPYR